MQSAGDYKDREVCHFITFQTVDWIDVFIRPVYKQVIVHTLNHFIESKGLIVHAWCLMTHHLHLLVQVKPGISLEELEKEYRLFTTTKILEAIETEPQIRKEWIMDRFHNMGSLLGFSKKFNVWQDCSEHVYIDLRKKDILLEHFDYIHQNPVRDKVVDVAGEYMYSSARDYSGIKGLVSIAKLPAVEQQLAASETMNGNFFVKYIRN
jgi:putative transposase